jgi:glycosyltransferase involved in cell wall biosynthesis
MKILHVNQSDLFGGASRAAYRIHIALCRHGLDSMMGVDRKISDAWKVFGPRNRIEKVLIRMRHAIGSLILRMLNTESKVLHSPSILSSSWTTRQHEFRPDILHLHWVCAEMLSIRDIARLRYPVVWTLHDMWPFCGAEHYTDDFRWRDGYTRKNRPTHESGFDLNRWVWERKRKHWVHPLHIVTPSRWLSQCVQQSVLFRGWPVTVIPNALDTDRWAPVDQRIARSLLGLPLDEPLLLFGAMNGGQEPIKGFDLLVKALQYVVGERKDLHLAIFGESAPRDPIELPFPTHYMGRLHDDVALQM